jgi:hypothetical protein
MEAGWNLLRERAPNTCTGQVPVIVCRLPPSEPNGDLTAVIHTPAFHCFVSTALVDGKWETLIFEGDPGLGETCSPRLRFVYPPDCDAHDAALMNELVAMGLDMYAEAGLGLVDCGERVAQRLIRKGIMIQVFWPSGAS